MSRVTRNVTVGRYRLEAWTYGDGRHWCDVLPKGGNTPIHTTLSSSPTIESAIKKAHKWLCANREVEA